jgi:hypothetical protein
MYAQVSHCAAIVLIHPLYSGPSFYRVFEGRSIQEVMHWHMPVSVEVYQTCLGPHTGQAAESMRVSTQGHP